MVERGLHPRAEPRRREASESVGPARIMQGKGRGERAGRPRLLPSPVGGHEGPRSPRSWAPEASLAGARGRRPGPGAVLREEAARGAPPRARERVQGSAVFRLPFALTRGAQRPPGCAAMAQPSSRCQINEPTSGWVYSSAGKQPSGK